MVALPAVGVLCVGLDVSVPTSALPCFGKEFVHAA